MKISWGIKYLNHSFHANVIEVITCFCRKDIRNKSVIMYFIYNLCNKQKY